MSDLIPAAMNLATKILGGQPNDTGQNVPEQPAALMAQRQQLMAGQKPAMMFPRGTPEMSVPQGAGRVETPRGAFHFNPGALDAQTVARLSGAGRENAMLGLGPFNKDDIMARVRNGEPPLAIVERGPQGEEVKAAIGTQSTAPHQLAAFQASKSPNTAVGIEPIESVIAGRRRGGSVPSGGVGGQVHVGPIKSAVAGRTDHIAMKVPANSFVIPADIVSGLGEGNTDAGHQILSKMFPEQGLPSSGDGVEIMAAGGEHVISPEECARIGGNDVERGHKILDRFVIDQRKRLVKTLSKLPGPVRD
jgi:hypothetical protein